MCVIHDFSFFFLFMLNNITRRIYSIQKNILQLNIYSFRINIEVKVNGNLKCFNLKLFQIFILKLL